MRDHDVSNLTAGELERARRELAANLAMVRPDSPARVPILALMTAIEAELGQRATSAATGHRRTSTICLCSCGFGTDDREWLEGHLFQYPSHHERTAPGSWLP